LPRPALSVVIVSWNVRPLLERCLASVLHSAEDSQLSCELVVVDNASSDGSADMVRQRFPVAKLLVAEANLGFTRGNNLGLAQAGGDHLLLLNPDTEIIGNALAVLVQHMDAQPDMGVLGPRLLFPDGRTQPSRRRFPTLATAFVESTVVQQWLPRLPILKRYYMQDRSDDEEQDVDWVVGACMLVRRQAWEQVGPLDERFFMYSEELDWCRRFKAGGWRVAYLPSALVIHYEGQSSNQVVAARHIHFQSSKVLYFRKYYGARAGELLRCFVLATYLFQLIEESLKWLAGHKRPLRRQRISAYWQVLRSRLQAPRGVVQ
jgi:N-acetylglucosaminyl-diphospho-decaprenol L-rhamnosyltransferase